MKRFLSLILALIILSAASACTTAPAKSTPSALKDGTYRAEALAYDTNGFKSFVELTVSGGKITKATYDALVQAGGLKSDLSKAGKYDMKNNGLKWHEQAAALSAKVVEVQDPLAIKLTSEGKTDAVSGVTIHVSEFVGLAERAVKQAKGQPQGPYKDGEYKAESAEFDQTTGFKDTIVLTVKDGLITNAKWDAVHKDGGKTKVERSLAGEYDMKNNGLKWHEQAKVMENALLNAQDPAKLTVNSEGKTDAVSGVTIHVSAFVKLASEALAKAK